MPAMFPMATILPSTVTREAVSKGNAWNEWKGRFEGAVQIDGNGHRLRK